MAARDADHRAEDRRDLPLVFFDARYRGKGARLREADAGLTIFARASSDDRLRTIEALWQAKDEKELNPVIVGSFLRSAHESEPYLNGQRLGSYLSAWERLPTEFRDRTELFWLWGSFLMSAKEARQLRNMQFPLTAYRGGLDDPVEVASGHSWTTDMEVAKFYAEQWPRRWGRSGSPIVMQLTLHRGDVTALLQERSESELIVLSPSVESASQVALEGWRPFP